MKLFRFATLALAFFFLAQSGLSSLTAMNTAGVRTPATFSAAQSTSVEAEIRALDEIQAKAWVARDQSALERLWSPDFVIHAPSNQILTREGAFREMKMPRLELVSLERAVERVTQFNDIAVSMGIDRYIPKNGPSAGVVHTQRYTNVWRREGATWRKIARHANVLPLSANQPASRD